MDGDPPRLPKRRQYYAAGGALCCVFTAINLVVLTLVLPTLVTNSLPPYAAAKQPFWVSPTNNSHSKQPVYMAIYVNTITNPWAVRYHGAKPILQEMGPYIYDEYLIKGNISYNADKSNVSYTYQQIYAYNDEKTKAANPHNSNQDMVCHPNLVMWAIAYSKVAGQLGGIGDLAWPAMWHLWNNTKMNPILNHTVQEFIFGYEDQFIKEMCTTLGVTGGLCTKGPMVSMQSPNNPWYYNAISVQDTGKKNISKLGKMYQWAGRTELDWWATPEARQIVGTDGSQFHPFLDKKKDKHLKVFVDSLYRSAYVEYKKVINLYGMDVWRYGMPKAEMQNATENPVNAGYNMWGPTGVQNITAVMKTSMGLAAPVFDSVPYFIWGDPWYRHQITLHVLPEHEDVWNKDPDSMLTWIDVEPTTGATVAYQNRLQISLQMVINSTDWPTWNIKNGTYFPMFWVHTSASASKKTIHGLHTELTLVKVAEVVVGCLAVIAGVCTLAGIGIAVYPTLVQQEQRHTLGDEEAEKLTLTKVSDVGSMLQYGAADKTLNTA